MNDYLPIRVYSVFSKGEGAVEPAAFADLLQQRGLPFLPVCDPLSLIGWDRFKREAEKRKMRPVLGCEIRLPEKGSLLLFPASPAGYFSLIRSLNGRKIVPLTLPDWDRMRNGNSPAGFSFNDNIFFQKLLAAHPKSLILTGQVGVDMKATSIIQEVRDDRGKKKNAFVTQKLWNADAKIVLIESDTGKTILEKSHSEKTTLENVFVLRYQFGQLLDRLGDKLMPELQRKKRFQERYILK